MMVICVPCTTAYPPDVAQCPHCGSRKRYNQGDSPPKEVAAKTKAGTKTEETTGG